MKKRPFLTMIVFLTFGCVGKDSVELDPIAEPFEVYDEDAALPIPTINTLERVEYEAGDVPWVKPSYRLVFHLLHESLRHQQSNELASNEWQWERASFVGARVFDDTWHHRIGFPTWNTLHTYLGSKLTHQQNMRLGKFDGSNFYGIYFPKNIGDELDPSLHLFECPAGERAYYLYNNTVVECQEEGFIWFHVPIKTHAGNWLVCQSFWWNNTAQKSPFSWTSEPNECSNYNYIQQYIHITWPGGDPVQNIMVKPVKSLVSSQSYDALQKLNTDLNIEDIPPPEGDVFSYNVLYGVNLLPD